MVEDSPRGWLLADAFDVFTGSGVDFDLIPLVDEDGDLDLGAGLDGGTLGDVGGGVASSAGLGVGDFKNEVIGWIDADGSLVVEDDAAGQPVLEPFGGVTHLLGGQFGLIESVWIHEDKVVAVAIEVLHLRFSDVGGLQTVIALEGSIEDRALEQALQFALIESLPLSRLDEVAFRHDVGFPLDLDFDSLAKVAGVIDGHSFGNPFLF